MSNVVLNILSEFKGKAAFKQADTAVAKLQKSVRNLAGGLGIAYGTRAIAAFGKEAVKAFAADEAAALRLSNAVDNLGISFANVEISKFISDLESAAGIADDVLRPAFQGLLTTTGSLTQSQKLLNDAITISRGTGVELATVAQDLANGYVGVTRGLRKYNTGLTQSELKTKSFSDILGILLKQSSGAANAYLSTTSFKFDVLTVAVDNAREMIGKGLVDALARAGGGTEAKDAVKTINAIAKGINAITLATGTAVGGLTSMLSNLSKLPKNIFQGFAGKAGGISTRPSTQEKKETLSKTAQQKALAKLEKDSAKRAKELIAMQTKASKALTAEQKKQAALKKANSVFDIENANLYAALQGNLTKEEQDRVKALLALNNDNATAATHYTSLVLKAQDATGRLAELIRNLPTAANPFANWVIPMGIPSTNAANVSTVTQAMGYAGAGSTAMAEKQSYVINVAGSVVSEQGLIDAVRGGLNVASLSGSGSTVRRIGGF